MKIPNADQAFVDIDKLSNYCLSYEHPRGKHKARLFNEILGITANDAEEFKRILLNIIRTNEVLANTQDQYGKRYIVDFLLKTTQGSAKIRSSWIILNHESFPRLTTCYILRKESRANE